MSPELRNEGSVSPEAIQAELEKILASQTFAPSEQLRGFLRFTIEKTARGLGDHIKEYLVGVEVFGRGEGFDPRTDSIVRAQANKLRARLARYYAGEGRHDEVIIEYPKGSYVPVFERRQPLSPGKRFRLLRLHFYVPAAAVLLAGIVLGLNWQPSRSAARQTAPPSIAVLPFIDMSEKLDQDYFCDGMTEELINALAQLQGLRIVARTSVFEFKGKARDIRQIGRQLNVRDVLEGSVRKAGDKLRVTVQLNDVATGYHLWSEAYDRDVRDVFAIQEEIARAVVNKLNLGEAQPLIKKYVQDPEAYDLYLRGRQQLNTNTAEALKLAAGFFQQSLARNPEYAPGYSGMAEAWYWLAMRSGEPPRVAFPKAKDAARKALELDTGLAEAHSALAAVLYSYDWDWQGAGREFQRAMVLRPNDAAIHQLYGRYLTVLARQDDALRELRRARELDPISITVRQHLATLLFLRRDFDAAIEEYRQMIVLDPSFYMAYSGMGVALLGKGKPREAMEAYTQGWTLSAHRDPMALAWLADGAATTGDRARAESLLADLRQLSTQRYVRPALMAMVYAGMGDKDQAFAWLDRAWQERDVQFSLLRMDFRADSLRGDPRFNSLFERMQLPHPDR